jgi:uncharacterized membrane protein YkoI
MHGLRVRLAAGMVLAASILVPATRAHEEQLPLAHVPKPVLDAVQARFANARITGAAKETENGRMVYEVTLVEQGRNVDVTSSPSGELLTIEKTIEAGALPDIPATALQSKYPGATYRSVEEVVELGKQPERPAYYEVELETADRHTVEVKVTPDGAIITGQDEHKGDKDKDKDKDKQKQEHDDDDDGEGEG